MRVLRSVAIAFSMFSRVPMPRVLWNADSMRYTMAAFPLVGVVVGGVVLLWGWLAGLLGMGGLLCGAGFALLPVLVTGGIHLDGYCDTVDALSSRADREKKLEILKDPNAGAFAVIGVCCYLILYVAAAAELRYDMRLLLCLGCGFVASRALSGLAVVFFRCARSSGLAHTFADGAARAASGVVLALFLLAAGAGMVAAGGLYGVAMLCAALVVFGIYYAVAMASFGGITGDLAGWFLQLCELVMLCVLVALQLAARAGWLPWM